jgi:hypothetical protein
MAVRLSAVRADRAPFTLRKFPGTNFYQRLSRPQEHIAAGKIRSIEKSSDIENRTRDLPACSRVPQPTTLPRAPSKIHMNIIQPSFHAQVQNSVLRFFTFYMYSACPADLPFLTVWAKVRYIIYVYIIYVISQIMEPRFILSWQDCDRRS